MNYITDEMINITGTIHYSLNNIKTKQQEINKIKHFINNGKNDLQNFGDCSLTLEQKLYKISEIESGLSELEQLLQNEILKVKQICKQYNVSNEFEVASILNDIL